MSKIVTVWGNPGCGKSMFCCCLAKVLTARKEKAIIINADSGTPMLPVWMPGRILETSASIGNVLTGLEINTALVAKRVTILKEYPFIGVMGYAAGENPFSYPEPKYDKIKLFIAEAAKLVDYLILDCSSNMLSFFTPTAIEAADVTVRIITPDLRGLNYLRAHRPLLMDDKFHYGSHLTFAGLARPFHAIDEMTHLIGGFDGLLPYAKEVERCGTGGQMFKAIAYCNQHYVSSLKLVRERLMKPEGAANESFPEENGSFYEDQPEDTGDAPLPEGNGVPHEDAGQPEEFTEAQEAETPENAGSQKTTEGSWYAALAGNDRQEAPAGKEMKHHGHGILK